MVNSSRRREDSRGIMWLAQVFLLALATIFLSTSVQAQEDFLDPEEAFVFSAAMATPERVDVHFKVAPEYYMYRDRFQFALEPEDHASRLGEIRRPPGLVQYDPTFDEDLEVYYGEYTLEIPVEAGADQELTLRIISQGCADAGLCYSPSEHVLTLTPTDDGYHLSGDGVVDKVPSLAESTAPEDYASNSDAPEQSVLDFDDNGGMSSVPEAESDATARDLLSMGDTGFASYLSQANMAQILALAFVFGLLLSFTPCVLPMVPILLALLSGSAGKGQVLSKRRGVALAAAFVLGMSIVYTALGVAAGLLGASLAAWLQTPWVLTIFALLLLLFALAMFDVFTLQLPLGLQNRLNQLLDKIPAGRYGGVFLMGMISALIVGPCVAAPLAGVLLFISQTGDVVLGGSALFAMAWGQGLLLLLVGASSGVLMPKAGPWMEGIKRLFGILLLATAWWMVSITLPGWLVLLGWALLAIWSAVLLGLHQPMVAGASVGAALRKAIAWLLMLWGILLIVGLAAGSRDISQPLQPFTAVGMAPGSATAGANELSFSQASSLDELDAILASTDRPVMLDFYADWCVSCIQMEKLTYSDPEVASRMGKMQLVQADVTENSPEHRALLKRFNLFGPPGIIFFDEQGGLIEDVRVVGFQHASQFARTLDRVLP